ncbi:MAG TPA: class III poly(R)-hydroxyalkanoic acid synthase subunit PhaE [Xanthomonadaceae bacterium]|nr:class III poly(R)-hydroxyalkanoic acid synthase subunit PhaE [Xanthomonadaceae bacterium]
MSDTPKWQRDIDALGRQYWEAWSGIARGSMAGARPAAPNWHEGLELWARLTAPGSQDTGAALERFTRVTRRYLEFVGKVSERAGGKASAADISRAWREALASHGDPMLDALASMTGEGATSLQQMGEAMQQAWAPAMGEARALLSMPALGLAREHVERWQRLGQAQLEYSQQFERYAGLMAMATEKAFARFEHKLAECSEPGRQIDSMRALVDLWIDAAEEAYAEVALSEEFREIYGALVNAQMRVRQGMQGEVERMTGGMGMPTRSEIDSAHRRAHALQREVRELRSRLERLERDRVATDAAPASGKPAAGSGRRGGAPAQAGPNKATAAAARKPAAPRSAAGSPGAARRSAAPVRKDRPRRKGS